MSLSTNLTASSVATVHRWIESISARDFTTTASLYTPNATISLTGDPMYFDGAGMHNASFISATDKRLFSPFQTFSIELLHIFGVETNVWAEFTERGTFNDSRPSYQNMLAAAFVIEDSKIVQVREYVDSATIQRLDVVESGHIGN